MSQETIENYRHRAENEARTLLDAFARTNRLTEAGRTVRHGPASLRIREVARDTDADLIVLGAQGKGAMETALLGSVSLRLVTAASCDVLLARIAG